MTGLGSRTRAALATVAVLGLLSGIPAAISAVARPSPTGAEVLTRRCLKCHGQAGGGGLDLRTRAAALRGGGRGPAIAERPADSLLLKVLDGSAGLKMPPGAPLPAPEIAALQRWLAAGAAWPGEAERAAWWSLRPLASGSPPRVRREAWARNPIDRFVLAGLEQRGLQPAPPADARTLIRRVTYDLIGLPPTPEAVERFAADRRPDAYERLVDGLLASPRYGERWARHWLDVVRFAESQGFERDKIRDHAWRYRDYVIGSFNTDRPYNQFMREQIAGDLLAGKIRPGSTGESIAATGFLVAGPWDEVGATQASQPMRARVREEELEDMVSAVGQTFLGLTVNCARCHNHKFDPVPQIDYFRIQACLAGVRHGDRPAMTPSEQSERVRQRQEAENALVALEREASELEGRGRARVSAAGHGEAPPVLPAARWTFEQDGRDALGRAGLALTGGAVVRGGRLVLDGREAVATSAPLPFSLGPKTLEAWVTLSDLEQRGGGVLTVEDGAGSRFDSLVYGERQARRWVAGSENHRRTQDAAGAAEEAPPGRLVHVAIVYDQVGRILLYRDGGPYGAAYRPEAPPLTFAAGEGRVLLGLRHSAGARPKDGRWFAGEIDEARLYDRPLTPAEVRASFQAGPRPVARQAILAALSPEERARLAVLDGRITEARRTLAKIEPVPLVYAATTPLPAPEVRVLARGEASQPGAVVSPGGLACIPGLPADFGLAPDAGDRERRLALADWLADRRNPLPARVMVNRVWQGHFGRGLVGTPSDFGAQGDRPTHPELLEWLAAAFAGAPGSKGSGVRPWSVKSLHRLIVTSSTYRQDGRPNPRAAAIDSENRLLWRMPLRRLEAETIRDAILQIDGTLNVPGDRADSGPGFRPFRVTISNSHFYTPLDDDTPEMRRRSVFRTVVNSGGIPLLDPFDCPDPSVKTPRRAATITPLQALVLLNNSFVLRHAGLLSERCLREGRSGGPRTQVSRAISLAMGRPALPDEVEAGAEFVRRHSLPAYCRLLLNANEFLYVR